jgi:hypothetical protein
MGPLKPRTDEDPITNKTTICIDIPGSAGKEDAIMKCCAETAGAHWYMPWQHDCHGTVKDCLSGNGIAMPTIPGGRGLPPCVPIVTPLGMKCVPIPN